jgi:DNA-binding FadR family transcriptional regulator
LSRKPKKAQRIAEQIERNILNRGLPTGHRLGTEPELIAKYRVSRAVLREAIRIVERHQLVETRRGNLGGIYVAQPAEDAIARVLCAYLESIGLEQSELFEARSLLESALARSAAIRGSRDAAALLESILRERPEFESAAEGADLFDRFYVTLGAVARNPVLGLCVRTLHRAAEHVALGRHFGKPRAAEAYQRVWKSMLGVAHAIGEHDALRAEKLVRQRLEREDRWWRELPQRKRRPVGDALKQGDALAREISDEIRSKRYAPGDLFGSEAELIRHYGVSRASLREAIRMLEQHGIAEMRRGLDGGLCVCEPDAASVIRSASIYLAQLSLDIRSIKETRLLIEPAAAALACERARESDLAVLAAEHVRVLTLRSAAAGQAARTLHERIGDLSGNRALALFARVIIAAAWGVDSAALSRLPSNAIETIRASDTRIVGALHARDAKRAHELVTLHLEITLEWWAALHSR